LTYNVNHVIFQLSCYPEYFPQNSRGTSSALSHQAVAERQPSSPATSTLCALGIDYSETSSRLPNGKEVVRPRRLGGDGQLEVDNGTPTDAVVSLVDLQTNKAVRRFYVEANQKFTESGIAPGTYQVYFETGSDWNLVTRSFNNCAKTQRFPNIFEEAKDEATHVSITLHNVVGGNTTTILVDKQSYDAMMAQSE